MAPSLASAASSPPIWSRAPNALRRLPSCLAGLTLANVLGVPAGTALGPGLRVEICLLGHRSHLPRRRHRVCFVHGAPRRRRRRFDLKHEFHAVVRPQVQLVLAMSTLSSVSLFCVFTYIAPILEQVTHLSPTAVTRVLVVFGVGITLGNLMGGRLADWKQMPVLICGNLCLLILIFLAMPLAGNQGG